MRGNDVLQQPRSINSTYIRKYRGFSSQRNPMEERYYENQSTFGFGDALHPTSLWSIRRNLALIEAIGQAP